MIGEFQVGRVEEGRGKNWKVIDTFGTIWYMNPLEARKLSAGHQVKVEYDRSEFKGNNYNIVKEVLGNIGETTIIPPKANGSPQPVKDNRSLEMFIMSTNRILEGFAQTHSIEEVLIAMPRVYDTARGWWESQYLSGNSNSDVPF